MKQEISHAIPPSHPRVQFYRRMGLVLIAALALGCLGLFTSTSAAHASGGCMSYNTWSNNAAGQYNTNPIMYENSNSPALGLGLNSCTGSAWEEDILISMQNNEACFEGCPMDFQIAWTRSGVNGWQWFDAPLNEKEVTLSSVQFNAFYEVAVKECLYSGGVWQCGNWSPTVWITT